MFRKYYKAANNDIKPDEELINRVMKNVHKKQPPAFGKGYYKYAASVAAAVVLVAAAVISMPMWQRIDNSNDGVLIEESVTETMPPQSTDTQDNTQPDAFPAQNPQTDAAAGLPENQYSENGTKPAQKNTSNSNSDYESSNNTFSGTAQVLPRQSENTAHEQDNAEAEKKINSSDITSEINDMTEENDYSHSEVTEEDGGKSELIQEVENASLYEVVPERTPPPEIQNASASDYSAAKAESEVLYDESLPTPTGYYCVSASWDGYTFVSDDGAVITVEIKYGGEEESEPYYSVDGENIYASFTAYGMTVTVSASGADMSTVEEIINSLR